MIGVTEDTPINDNITFKQMKSKVKRNLKLKYYNDI